MGDWDTMSQAELVSKPAGSISIDQLLALNEEIAALVRAGVPLERGLLDAGSDIRGRLGRITSVLGRRMSQGESLAEALDGEKQAIPPLYRAVVEAGTRAGRLTVALEGLARYVRGYSEARTAIGLALWYPLIVLSLAYGLFIGFVSVVVPRFVTAFESLGLAVIAPLRWLERLGESAQYWWPVGPVLLVVLLLAWVRSGTAAGFHTRFWNWLRFFPWMGSLLADYEAANFSELLALLLQHQVPYPSALVLAAESSGSPRLVLGASRLAEALRLGKSAATALENGDGAAFLPMLRWTLATGQTQGSLPDSLHNLADIYRKRAKYLAEKLYLFLPVLLMVVIGAGATLLYGLSLFIPLVNLLKELPVR
jgi:general secretion pathway protein F